jgi:3-oxoacyl-[acyl-carrier protein] reductase
MKNNISVVIGGTSGIGFETACYLKGSGYEVIIGGRSKCEEEEGIACKYIDVTKEDSIQQFFSSINVDSLGSLVYSAGVTMKRRSIEDFNVSDYLKLHDVNLLGAILTLKYAYPLLKKAGGKVVVVNSFAARTYSQFSGFEYTITKSGLSGMVKQLAIEWAKDGVLINAVFPSMVETSMLRSNVDESVLRDVEKKIPLGRLAKPKEIASAIEFLISSKNTYATGAGIDINGGQFLVG